MSRRKKEHIIIRYIKWLSLPLLALIIYAIVVSGITARFDSAYPTTVDGVFWYWFRWIMICGIAWYLIDICLSGRTYLDPNKKPK